MRDPLVSVIVPAYNAERHIGDALESIRTQTRQEIEVIVVDDGSTDGTVHEAGRYASALNLVIIAQANAGPAAARNAGIRRARGRYCAFLDSDDLMLPGRIAAQAELLEAQPSLGLVHTDLMTFDERGIIHRTRRAFSNPCGGMVLDRLLLDNFITTSTVMAPTARLLDAGLFGEERRVSEDFELWLRMAARWQVGFIDRPLVQYRRRRGSLSDDKLATALCALDVIETFWREHPQHRGAAPRIYRDSMAQHLSTAGSAALARGNRASALAFVVRSLWLDPGAARSWKALVKTLIRPRPQARAERPSITAGQA